MDESPIKWSFEELKIKLPEELTIGYNGKKQNKAKNNCLIDSGILRDLSFFFWVCGGSEF